MHLFKTVLLLLFCLIETGLQAANDLTLWYAKPAVSPHEALPIGNGRLGALLYADPTTDHIQFNETSVMQSGVSQAIGELTLFHYTHTGYSKYRRQLDLRTGVSSVEYTHKGITYRREYLASLTDSVIIVRISASKPASVSCKLTLTTIDKTTKKSDGEVRLIMQGTAEAPKGKAGKARFAVQVKPLAIGGRLGMNKGYFTIINAEELILYISIASNVNADNELTTDEMAKCTRLLNRAYGKPYDQMMARHITAYQKVFNQVSLDLGQTKQADKPTDQRLRDFPTTADPSLVSLYFQFARYLQITSTQPAGYPAPVQGLWNDQLFPAWDNQTTTKININRNYPLFEAVWLSHHLWDHYLFTGDQAFLTAAFPLMQRTARLLAERLSPDSVHGWLELPPMLPNAQSTADKAIDNQFVADLFNNTIQATDLLYPGLMNRFSPEKAFADTLKDQLKRLAPLSGTRSDQWFGLYPANLLSPYRTPELCDTVLRLLQKNETPVPEWPAALTINLWARLLDGNQAWTWLKDQLKPVGKTTSAGGLYPTLIHAKARYQVGENFGNATGIAELLLQSQDGFIFLLPALPDDWKVGSVKGLKARGGFAVDMEWDNGQLQTVTIHSSLGGNCRIRSWVALTGENLKPEKGDNKNSFYKIPVLQTTKGTPKSVVSQRVMPASLVYDLPTEPGNTYVLKTKPK